MVESNGNFKVFRLEFSCFRILFENNQLILQLEESKVFTASNVQETTKVFSGMGDNDAKMFTPPVTVDSFSSTFSSLASAANGGPALNDTTNTLRTGASLINSISQSPIGTRNTEQLGQKYVLFPVTRCNLQLLCSCQNSVHVAETENGLMLSANTLN